MWHNHLVYTIHRHWSSYKCDTITLCTQSTNTGAHYVILSLSVHNPPTLELIMWHNHLVYTIHNQPSKYCQEKPTWIIWSMWGMRRSIRTSTSMTSARQTFFLTSVSLSSARKNRFCKQNKKGSVNVLNIELSLWLLMCAINNVISLKNLWYYTDNQEVGATKCLLLGVRHCRRTVSNATVLRVEA